MDRRLGESTECARGSTRTFREDNAPSRMPTAALRPRFRPSRAAADRVEDAEIVAPEEEDPVLAGELEKALHGPQRVGVGQQLADVRHDGVHVRLQPRLELVRLDVDWAGAEVPPESGAPTYWKAGIKLVGCRISATQPREQRGMRVRTFCVEVFRPVKGGQTLVHDDSLVAQLVLVYPLLKQ